MRLLASKGNVLKRDFKAALRGRLKVRRLPADTSTKTNQLL